MSLFLPAALSLKSLNGGYKGHLDFTALADNETNSGRNVVITPTTIRQRKGYRRLLDSALTDTGVREVTGLSGDRVLGHFYFKKSTGAAELERHVVAAGRNLWNYTSSTAEVLLAGLTDDENAIWTFAQIMDPNDGADDIVVGTNGHEGPVYWNGTDASANFLSSIAGSSGVMPAKYLVAARNRICLMNIQDSADVDSKSRIMLSEMNTASTPSPHVFPSRLQFPVGGSDKYGEIMGGAVLQGNILVFKKNTFYYFDIAGGATVDEATLSIVHDFSLKQVDENIGCVAPRTIVSVGNAIIWLSELGVYGYNGSELVYLSEPIEGDLRNIDFARKKFAAAGFNRETNEYWLAVTESGHKYNNRVFVYNLTEKKWHLPYDDMRCDIISNYYRSSRERLLSGDQMGYLYELDEGCNNGKCLGYNRTPSTLTTGDTLNFYDSQSIDANGDGLLGLSVRALGATGANALPRIIIDSTGTQITVDRSWGAAIDTGTEFALLAVDSRLRTKDFDFGNSDLAKMVRKVTVRSKPFGHIDYRVNYIFDFRETSEVGTATISQYNEKYLYPTEGTYATGSDARFSGTIETVHAGICEVSVSAGTDLSASALVGYGFYFWNSGTRRVFPIAYGECETLRVGNYGTASLVAVNTNTTYLINTNLKNCAGTAKWGPAPVAEDAFPVRAYKSQPMVGEHFALEFYNNRANEKWEIYGLDIIAKPVGRR